LIRVDLAGSERSSRTQTEGNTQREAKFINVSLLELGLVVALLLYIYIYICVFAYKVNLPRGYGFV